MILLSCVSSETAQSAFVMRWFLRSAPIFLCGRNAHSTSSRGILWEALQRNVRLASQCFFLKKEFMRRSCMIIAVVDDASFRVYSLLLLPTNGAPSVVPVRTEAVILHHRGRNGSRRFVAPTPPGNDRLTKQTALGRS